MPNNEGRKTEQAYWETNSQRSINYRLPSGLNVGIRNIMQLLSSHVKPGSHYLEIGCAPGKMLAWVAGVLNADVEGIDYSEHGIAHCRVLFDTLRLKGKFHHEDIFDHHLPSASFDVVASFGVLEHFENARIVVQKHLDLVRPGGISLIAIPNYGGLYGSLQHWCDAPNLKLHNLKIMNPDALASLIDSPEVSSVRAYPFGAMSPWIVSLDKRLPHFVAKLISLGINAAGLMQCLTISAIAPLLVLEVHKGSIK